MAKIVGFGGCFFKCESPMALSAWYHRCLNMPIEREGGASLPITQLPQRGFQVWGPFRQDADYFEPGRKDFMINLIVDDIEGAMAQITEGGGQQVGDIVVEDFDLVMERGQVERWRLRVASRVPSRCGRG